MFDSTDIPDELIEALKGTPLDEGVPLHHCVKCGYCCMVRPCGYAYSYARKRGEDLNNIWDAERKRCIYLQDDNSCGIYDTIKQWDDSMPENMRMFDCGCSSPLCNDHRDNKIKEQE